MSYMVTGLVDDDMVWRSLLCICKRRGGNGVQCMISGALHSVGVILASRAQVRPFAIYVAISCSTASLSVGRW